MRLELKEIHWSIWRSLASRKRGFWKLVLKRFIHSSEINEELTLNSWRYYKRTAVSGVEYDLTDDFNEALKAHKEKWDPIALALDTDQVLTAISPKPDDLLKMCIKGENLFFTFSNGSWKVIFGKEEMTTWKYWLAYSGSIA